jgi:hypothetical protein
LQKPSQRVDRAARVGVFKMTPAPAGVELRLLPRRAWTHAVPTQIAIDPDQGTRLLPSGAAPISLRREPRVEIVGDGTQQR